MDSSFAELEEKARKMDRGDPLARFRNRFYSPEGTTYMDGNSLGLTCKDAEESFLKILDEWKRLGIDGWLRAEQPWFHFAERVGAMMAPLVGAEEREVVCTGGTTLNIHSLIATFYRPGKRRTKILADELNFPTDIYALKGQLRLRGLDPERHLILVKSRDGKTLRTKDIVEQMSDEIAVALFSSVLYRSGQLLDVPLLTQKAHERGIIIGFDLSHSAGALPHSLSGWDVDFALWCGYKYLNGGPGSPAFLYVNRRHFQHESLLSGWFGCRKERQFDLLLDFYQERSAGGWQISTPSIMAIAGLEGALKILNQAGIENIREKSLLLTSFFIELVQRYLTLPPYEFRIATPLSPDERGGHVAIEREKDAWQICGALKSRGVVSDFRPPNIIRIAPVALYNTFYEVWQVADHLREIVERGEHQRFSEERLSIT